MTEAITNQLVTVYNGFITQIDDRCIAFHRNAVIQFVIFFNLPKNLYGNFKKGGHGSLMKCRHCM